MNSEDLKGACYGIMFVTFLFLAGQCAFGDEVNQGGIKVVKINEYQAEVYIKGTKLGTFLKPQLKDMGKALSQGGSMLKNVPNLDWDLLKSLK